MDPTERFIVLPDRYVDQLPDLGYLPAATTLAQAAGRELDAKAWYTGAAPGAITLTMAAGSFHATPDRNR